MHQFCRIGVNSLAAIATVITKDVPPFVMVSENPAKAHGLNREGLRRRGFSQETINLLRQAYRILYRQGLTVAEAVEQLKELAPGSKEVAQLIDFVTNKSTRGIVR